MKRSIFMHVLTLRPSDRWEEISRDVHEKMGFDVSGMKPFFVHFNDIRLDAKDEATLILNRALWHKTQNVLKNGRKHNEIAVIQHTVENIELFLSGDVYDNLSDEAKDMIWVVRDNAFMFDIEKSLRGELKG